MVEIRSFGSSSAGNCYQISDGDSSLLLEAGISPKKLRIDFSKVDALLLSHEHMDHSKYVDDFLRRSAINVFCTKGTAEALNVPTYRVKQIEYRKQFKIAGWQVMAFDVEHDAKEPCGFLIISPSGKKIVFATDTYYIRYKFIGVTHWMVECNYSINKVNELLDDGFIDIKRRNRLLESHFEINNVMNFFREQDLSKTEEVHLLHLSDSNSDSRLFKQKIQAVTGVPVYIAGGE